MVNFPCKGDTFIFGHYKQSADPSAAPEPIEWRVLDYELLRRRVLVISKYGLDMQDYHSKNTYPTWEKSDIRAWLNSTFLNTAFTAEEQQRIETISIRTPDYRGTSGGAITQDKLWLLDYEEATRYFSSFEDRQATPTAYAVSNGVWQFDGDDDQCVKDGVVCCWWWLRSPGYNDECAFSISDIGSFDDVCYLYGKGNAVRPAMWLDLSTAPLVIYN